MAKPSVTNIRPPATPPQMTWNLNSSTSGVIFKDDANFDAAVSRINYSGSDYSCGDDTNTVGGGNILDFYHGYDYVFFASNGGYDEQVTGISDKAGIIVTGSGNDTITGGDLGDLIFAGNGVDKVWGGDGDDIIYGENGADELHGGNGNDILDGGNGPDKLYGDAGNDWLVGGEGDDSLGGGADNDVLIGGAGNDTLVGGTDNGTFSISQGGETTVTKNGNAVFVWDHDPNGEITTTLQQGDQANQLRKEGVFVDGDGIHHVFSFVAGTTSSYTFAFYDGNGLDSNHTGDDPAQNPFTVSLTAGQKYYFSFEDDDGGSVKVFLGNSYDLTPPIISLASQGYDPESAFTITYGGEPELSFEGGDELCGGAGVDTFVWNMGDGVDVICDYNQGNLGSYDAGEGDVLQLNLAAGTQVKNTTDTDGNLVIYFEDADNNVIADSAIKLVGINDINQVLLDIHFV